MAQAKKKRSPGSSGKSGGARKPGKAGKAGKAAALAPTAVPTALSAGDLDSMPLGAGSGGGGDATLLLVGGSASDAGALVLAGTAALRAGAMQVEIGTARAIVALVTAVLPQVRGVGLDARRSGSISAAASRLVADRARRARVLLLGPGMRDGREAERFLGRIVARLDPKKAPLVILDGDVIAILVRFPDLLRRLEGRAMIVARRSQLPALAKALGAKGDEDPLALARAVAREWKALVVSTDPDGGGFVVGVDGRSATVAGTLAAPLRLPGVAAGLIAAFAARGAAPFDAAAWGLFVRSRATARVTETVGHHGYLAAELLAEVPRELAALAAV